MNLGLTLNHPFDLKLGQRLVTYYIFAIRIDEPRNTGISSLWGQKNNCGSPFGVPIQRRRPKRGALQKDTHIDKNMHGVGRNTLVHLGFFGVGFVFFSWVSLFPRF